MTKSENELECFDLVIKVERQVPLKGWKWLSAHARLSLIYKSVIADFEKYRWNNEYLNPHKVRSNKNMKQQCQKGKRRAPIMIAILVSNWIFLFYNPFIMQ